MPRAALLSIHARVEGTKPTAWEEPSLVQLWGPRFSAYVVAAVDAAVFTLGRLPDDPAGLKRAESTADRLEAFLGGRTMSYADAGHGDWHPPEHAAIRHDDRAHPDPLGGRPPADDLDRPSAGDGTARGAARARPSLSDGPRARDGRRRSPNGPASGHRGPTGSSTTWRRSWPRSGPRPATAGSSPPTSHRSAGPRRNPTRRSCGSSRAATPGSCSGVATARCSCRTRPAAASCGRRASGRGDPRRRRDRRRLAASLGRRLAVDVANALAGRARRRRRRSGVAAAARRRRPGPGQLGGRRRLM